MSDKPQSTPQNVEDTNTLNREKYHALRVIVAPPELRETNESDASEEPSKKYKTRRSYENPRDLFILDVVQRFFREGHSEDLRTRMVSMGYSSEFGLISWTWNRSLGKKICINGEHRLAAIAKQDQMVVAGKADPSTLEQFQKMEMLEYFNESEVDIPISDVLILSANANEKSSCVAPPSIADKMGILVNYLKLNPYLHGLSISAITSRLHTKGVLSGLTARTLRRYVVVGIVLLKNTEADKTFHKFCNLDQSPKAVAPGGMSLTILSNQNFTSATKSAQVLCLVCVHNHHVACKQSGKSASSPALTEGSCGKFFKLVCGLAGVVEAAASRRDMDIQEVYDFVVSHSNTGAKISTSTFIANNMKYWKPMDEATESVWSRGMERDIVERLLAALPQKFVPAPHGSQGSEHEEPLVDEANTENIRELVDLSLSDLDEEEAEEAAHQGEARRDAGRDGELEEKGGEGDEEGETSDAEVVEVESPGRQGQSSTGSKPECTPPKKRQRTKASVAVVDVEEPLPKRRTRAQTASSRLVQSIETGDSVAIQEPTSGSAPEETARVVAGTKKKSKKKNKRTKHQHGAEERDRNPDKFDDRVGPLPVGCTQQSEMYEQLLEMDSAELLYDDSPGMFALRKEHPAISVLGANGFLKVARMFQRYVKEEMVWDLFPRGKDGSERDKELHRIHLSETADSKPSMESFHCSFHGLFLRFHSDLYRDGYAIVNGLYSDVGDEVFPVEDSRGVLDMKKCIDTLFEYYAADEHVPNDEGWWDKNFWNPITNVGSKEDVNARAVGATRMFSPRHATNETMSKDNPLAYQARLYIDLLLAMLADVLRLRTHSFTTPGYWRHDFDTFFDISDTGGLYVPNSGGRFILSGKDCLRQRPHCDFQQPTRSFTPGSPAPTPSYFMMMSGADGFYLYVWKGSHREINHDSDEVKKLSEANVPTPVWVPPYSVLIGRGDVHHAGAGWADWVNQKKTMNYMYSVRYHVYLTRKGDHLGNHIYDKYYDVRYKWQE